MTKGKIGREEKTSGETGTTTPEMNSFKGQNVLQHSPNETRNSTSATSVRKEYELKECAVALIELTENTQGDKKKQGKHTRENPGKQETTTNKVPNDIVRELVKTTTKCVESFKISEAPMSACNSIERPMKANEHSWGQNMHNTWKSAPKSEQYRLQSNTNHRGDRTYAGVSW